jgi:hypothetical protein
MDVFVTAFNIVVSKLLKNTTHANYNAFAVAIDLFLKYIMCQPVPHLNNFRSSIEKSFTKEQLNILSHYFPAIKMILGNKKSFSYSESTLAQIISVVEQFFQCVLLQDSLLVFYIGRCSENDESIKLIYQLLLRKNTKGLMFIFDVTETTNDKTFQILSDLSTTSILEINPLNEIQIRNFLFQCLCPPLGDLDELAKALGEKSLGNPFHLKENLKCCQDLKLISFDENLHGWTWDAGKIRDSLFLSDNVVTNVISKLTDLDFEIVDILSFAAIIGNEIDIEFLQKVYNCQLNKETFVTAQKLAIIRPSSFVTKQKLVYKNRKRFSIAVESTQNIFEFTHSTVREYLTQKFEPEARFAFLVTAARLWSIEKVGIDYPKSLIEKINLHVEKIATDIDLEILFDLNCDVITKHSSGCTKDLLRTFTVIENIISRSAAYFWTKRREDVFHIKIEAAKSYLLHLGNDALDLETFEREMSPYAHTQENQLQILKIHLNYLLKDDKKEAFDYSVQKLSKVCELNFEVTEITNLHREINTIINGRSTNDVLDCISINQPEPRYVSIQEILSMLAIAFRDEVEMLFILTLQVKLSKLVSLINTEIWIYFLLLAEHSNNDAILPFFI